VCVGWVSVVRVMCGCHMSVLCVLGVCGGVGVRGVVVGCGCFGLDVCVLGWVLVSCVCGR
jgi:hypothetical protein